MSPRPKIQPVNRLASSRPTPAAAPAARKRLPRPCTAWALAGAALLGSLSALAQAPAPAPLPDDLTAEVQRLASQAALLVWPASATLPRVEVVVGRLDPRLSLAACQEIVPFLPPGARALGSTRIGLRCAKGPSAWRVTLPVTIKVWGPALVARTALPAGTVLQAGQFTIGEVDLASRPDAAIGQDRDAIGRTLQRGLAAGDALRTNDLRQRQYFSAGDTVRVVAVGAGFSVGSEGRALGPGNEGRSAQVRLESGRVITGVATGERRVEVAL